MSGGGGGHGGAIPAFVQTILYTAGGIVVLLVVLAVLPRAVVFLYHNAVCSFNERSQSCKWLDISSSGTQRAGVGGFQIDTDPERNVEKPRQKFRILDRLPVEQRGRHHGMKGTMPTVDCDAKGGTRTINPNTGMKSCFVPD